MFYATIIEDGQVLGVWKRVTKPKAIEVALHPIMQPSQKQMEQIQEQVRIYAEFLNKPVELKIKEKLDIAEKGEWGKNKK